MMLPPLGNSVLAWEGTDVWCMGAEIYKRLLKSIWKEFSVIVMCP